MQRHFSTGELINRVGQLISKSERTRLQCFSYQMFFFRKSIEPCYCVSIYLFINTRETAARIVFVDDISRAMTRQVQYVAIHCTPKNERTQYIVHKNNSCRCFPGVCMFTVHKEPVYLSFYYKKRGSASFIA